MSLFNAFGQGGFASLAQTLENIGNIVAPIAPEDEEHRLHHRQDQNPADDEDDDEEESFDDKIQGFFSNLRDNLTREKAPVHEPEPSSPGSFVSVELSDDSSHAGEVQGRRNARTSKLASTISSALGMVNGAELEKKVQQKYREQLEEGIEYNERRYAELQQSSDAKIAMLEKEVKEWKALAESTTAGYQGVNEQEREEEMNTLYEKLGSLTAELEQRDDELSAARERIAALEAQARAVPTVETATDSALVIEELETLLAAQKRETAELQEQLEEARDLQLQAEEREQRLRAEVNDSEEELTALTNQLRNSNMTIAALEQKVAELQHQTATDDSPDQQAETDLATLTRRVSLLEEQLAMKEDAVREMELSAGRLTEQVSRLTAQLGQAAEDRASWEAEQRELTARLQQLESALAASEAVVADQNARLAVQVHQQHDTASREDLEGQLREQYEQTITDLRSQLAAQAAEVVTMGAELERQEVGLAGAATHHHEVVAAHELALSELQAQLAGRDALLNAATAEMERLSTARDLVVEDLTIQLAQRTEGCTALQRQLQDQEAALSETDREYQVLSSEHERVLLRLNDQLTAAQDERATLQQNAQRWETACTAAEQDRQRLSEALRTTQERANTLAMELAAAQAQVGELEQKVLVQESSSSKLIDDVAALPSPTAPPVLTPTADSEALAALQGEHNKALKKLKLLTRQLKEKDAEIARMTGELDQRGTPSRTVEVSAPSAAADSAQVDALRAQLAGREEECAAMQTRHAAALSELQAQSERTAEELRTALVGAQKQVHALEDELTACRAALKAAEEEAEASKSELGVAQTALQQAQATHHQAMAARDAVLEQLVEVITATRRALRLEDLGCAIPELGGAGTVLDNAVSAIQSIKLLHEQLVSREKERSELKARCQASEAELEALHSQSLELTRALEELRTASSTQHSDAAQMSNHLQRELDGLRASLVSSEAERQRLLEEASALREQLDTAQHNYSEAQQRAQERHAEVESLRSAALRSADDLRAAHEQVAFLQNALQESEAALKETEEIAWKCKAEAAELLFAYEQEQGKVVAAVQAREEVAQWLVRCQNELERARAERETAAAESKGADNAVTVEQLVALHGFLAQATNALQLIGSKDGAPPVPSDGASFEQLLAKAAGDLVEPLVSLTRGAETAANLAVEAVVAFRAVAARREALEAEHLGLVGELESARQRMETATADVDHLRTALSSSEATLATAQARWTAEKDELRTQLQQQTGQVAILQTELLALKEQSNTATQRAQEEKQQLIAALHAAQATAAQGADQLQPLRAQVQKLDTENKQLHQVIAQLRQVRKTNKGESDNAIAERDELRSQCAALQTEVATLQDMLRSYRAMEATAAQLQADVSTLTTSLAASERNLETARRALALREKECYDKDAELEVTRSDMLIARQELDRRLIEVRNLQEAVSQVESEKAFAISRFQRDLSEKIDACKRTGDAERAQIVAQLQAQLDEEVERRTKAEGAAQDYELYYRKAEMEFAKERRKMQQTVENALLQLNNSESQVIDRMLVANLIVSYFKRRRSTDVLKIIAKVLAFDDEQLIAVGLKVPPIDLLGSLLTTVMGRPAPPPPVEGDNLAEQWINFLINESDQDAGNSAGLVPRTRSGSSGSTPKSSPKSLPAGVPGPAGAVGKADSGEGPSIGSGKQF